jgi:hypothetical protein
MNSVIYELEERRQIIVPYFSSLFRHLFLGTEKVTKGMIGLAGFRRQI